MKVLLTGATGFLGRYLAQHLRDGGHAVVGLSRDPEAARRRVPALEAAYGWAPLTEQPPAQAFAGVDAVVHLVGEPVAGRWTRKKKRALLDSRVLSTHSLVAAMEAVDPRPGVLLCASAVGWYGHRGDDILTEEEPAGDDFLAELCRRWEAEAQAADALGVRVVRMRNGLVLGPGGGFLGPQRWLYRLGLGGTLGNGRQWWSWVHQGDWARLAVHLLERPMSGAVNATSPAPVQQREFSRTLGRVLRRPAFWRVPAFALSLLMGELAQEALTSKRALPARALESGFEFTYQELEPALRDVMARWGRA